MCRRVSLSEEGIENILALRGDPPRGETDWKPTPGGLRYAVLDGACDVFLVSPNTIRRFTISVDDFEVK